MLSPSPSFPLAVQLMLLLCEVDAGVLAVTIGNLFDTLLERFILVVFALFVSHQNSTVQSSLPLVRELLIVETSVLVLLVTLTLPFSLSTGTELLYTFQFAIILVTIGSVQVIFKSKFCVLLGLTGVMLYASKVGVGVVISEMVTVLLFNQLL